MSDLHVPPSWQKVHPATWTGLVLVLGGTDTGKSTAVRVFYEALQEAIDVMRLGDVCLDPGTYEDEPR